MLTTTSGGFDPPHRKLCAPLWHTGLLNSIFVVLAAGGALFQLPTYAALIAMEWALFLYVRKGL